MGAYISSRRMNDHNSSQSSSEEDSDNENEAVRQYAALLHTLINSGQVEIMPSGEYLDNDFGPELHTKIPKIKTKPNTTILNKSEYALLTKMASGLCDQNKKHTGVTSGRNNILINDLLNRENGTCSNYRSFSAANKAKLTNRFLPNTMSVLDRYSGKVFCGIYSKDGDYFLTASQDRQIRLYESGDGSYKLFNTIRARDVGWSIIDVAFSPNKENFVYSTWSSSLHLCSSNSDDDYSQHQQPQQALPLVKAGRRFCVFSVMFSSDGKELLCGANDGCLYVYDCERNMRSVKISAHEYDVNTVAFADDSSHIIYSGGDDGLIKVWDRRTMGDESSSPKAVGVLAGHMDGITFIDSRGDGRHLISNSKDQTIKLWDVRIFSDNQAAENSLKLVHDQTWDYRWQQVPRKLFTTKNQLDGDTSIMTYRGHVVIKTLVRCRFSPIHSTGQRYIYTGSGTGALVVYDSLTGQIEAITYAHDSCVRDVHWHPYRDEICTSSWDCNVRKWTYRDPDYKDELATNCENFPKKNKKIREK